MLKLVALNCSLKGSKASEKSSTQSMLELTLERFKDEQVQGEIVRVADLNVKPGVTSDEGRGDAWPALRRKILAADILLIGTPIWLGQPSSVCKRVLERMDAFLDEEKEDGNMVSYGIVAAAAVVGNEDGAHHCSAEIFQALNDVGFTIPANAVSYWVGEAMGDTNFVDLRRTPKAVKEMIDMLARNTAHLARLLGGSPYPGPKSK